MSAGATDKPKAIWRLPAIWVVAVATAAVAYGADAPWYEANDVSFGGQSGAVRLSTSIDPVWIYASAGVAAFGLLVLLLFRLRAAFLLPATAALGAGVVLLSDAADLRALDAGGSIAWGVYLVGAASLVLLLVSLAGLAGMRR